MRKGSAMGIVQLGKEKAPGSSWGTFKYVKGASKKNEDKPFSRACCDRTRENGLKLEGGQIRLDY